VGDAGYGALEGSTLRLIAQKNRGVLLEAGYDIRTIQEFLGH